MSTCIFTDIVEITPVTTDSVFGGITEGDSFEVKAQWEEDSNVVYSGDGQPIDPNVWVFLPGDTVIKKGDKIKLVKKNGQDLDEQYTIQRKVRRANPYGDYGISHWECLL